MQINDVYESMVMTVARVGREWPDVDHALRDAIHHVAHAIPYVEAGDDSEVAVTRFAAHEAYVSVLALGQCLAGACEDSGEAGEVRAAYAAALVVLDTLGPHVSGADRALRSVLLDGEPLEAACRRLMSA